MKNVNIDGQMFKGPYRLDESEIPSEPALAIVATESGEGFQILGFIESDDIAKEAAESKWRDCWKKNGWHGVDLYIQKNNDKVQRQMLRRRMAEKRRESIKCEEFNKPEFE